MAWKLGLRKINNWNVNSIIQAAMSPESIAFSSPVKSLIHHVYGNFSCCDLCGTNVGSTYLLGYPLPQLLLCQYCLNDLPYFDQNLVAGNLLNWPAIHQALPNIHFEYLFALSPYLYPFTKWLAQLKYSGRFELAPLFSSLLCAQWQARMEMSTASPIDLVIPVPLHLKKWQVRGYNQSQLIAKDFAKNQALPYDEDLVIRVKNNDSQMGKTGKQRRKNLENAFAIQSEVASHIKHVLIIDDVVTTGTTVSEISKLLKSAGVETVTLVTVCLTLPKDKHQELISPIQL